MTKKNSVFSFLATVFFLFSLNVQSVEYKGHEKNIKNQYSIRNVVEKLPRKVIEEQLRSFVAASRPGRLVGSLGHLKARQYLESFLSQKNSSNSFFRKEEFSFSSDIPNLKLGTGVNFVWEKKGSQSPEQVIILGAHYDTLLKNPATKKIELKGEMPGADNNASGVAALLLMIEIFSKLDLPKTVRIVFFDAEELDSQGSRHFTQKLKEEASTQKIVGFINLTMIAHDTRITDKEKKMGNFVLYVREKSEVGSDIDSSFGKMMIDFGEKNYDMVSFIERPEASDNYPLTAKNFRNIGVAAITMTQNRESDQNPRYMTSNDFVETLNFPTYINVFKYVTSSVLAWNYDIVK